MANARRRSSGSRSSRQNTLSTQKVKSIVKKTLAQSRETKHHQQQALNQVIQTTGTNFDMVPAVGQGVGTGQRIGNEIQWKSYHVRMILKGGANMAQGHVFRVIWYTPRVNGTLMPNTVSVTDFLDQEAFVVHSDKIHKIGTNIDRSTAIDIPPSGVGAFKILNFGRRFKKPANMVFDNNLSSSLLSNHMRCYVVSTNGATGTYATSVDFSSTCYYTDA